MTNAALKADGFFDGHIVVRQILKILGDDRLFFQFLYLVKQMDQCLIDDFSVIHSSSPFQSVLSLLNRVPLFLSVLYQKSSGQTIPKTAWETADRSVPFPRQFCYV